MERRIPLGLKIAAAVAALIVGSIGLAYAAGVELPGQANDKAAEATADVEKSERDDGDTEGSSESRQGEVGSVSDDVKAVVEDRDEGGCEFGQEVAEAARANSNNDDAGADDPCENGEVTTEDDDDDAKEHEAKGSRETGSEHSSAAKDDDDSELEDVDENDDADDENGNRGEDNAAEGKEKAEEKSGEGQSNRPNDDE